MAEQLTVSQEWSCRRMSRIHGGLSVSCVKSTRFGAISFILH